MPNSKPENEKPSAPTSTELVPSGLDIAERIREEVRNSIDDRVKVIAKNKIEEKIRAHYFSKAQKLMEELWRECGKRTKHNLKVNQDDSNGSGNIARTCATCGMPSGYRADTRKISGITLIARKMREADQQAGIEFIPT